MAKHSRKNPAGGADYEVGYGRPPRHSRFQPGQSGNPAGRRKGVRNLGTDVQRTLKARIKVNEGGRSRSISTQEGALMVLREMALKGDPRALDRLLELAGRFNNEAAETEPQDLSTDDRLILAAYAAEISPPPASVPVRPPKQARVKLRPQHRKKTPS
jgi:hypothetical protein